MYKNTEAPVTFAVRYTELQETMSKIAELDQLKAKAIELTLADYNRSRQALKALGYKWPRQKKAA